MADLAGGDRFLDIEGVRLRWRIEGSGPAIVLLHGWALDLQSWHLVAPYLVSRFTVLRFDRRGFGLSTGLPDIHRNVADLNAVMDAAGVDAAAVLGMSQGARFAIHFALHSPQRTRALLLDGAPEIEAESELPLELYRALLEEHGEEVLRQQVLAHPLMQLQTQHEDARNALRASAEHYRGLDLMQGQRRAQAPDLRGIACPTLILNGGLDSKARRDAGAQLQADIAGAQRVELEGAGHLALLDQPQAYAQAVARFLQATALATCAEVP